MKTSIVSFPIPSPVDVPAGLGAGGHFPARLPQALIALALRRASDAVTRARVRHLHPPHRFPAAGDVA